MDKNVLIRNTNFVLFHNELFCFPCNAEYRLVFKTIPRFGILKDKMGGEEGGQKKEKIKRNKALK